MSVGTAVARWALRRPTEVSVFDEHRSRTWRELDERTTRLANSLVEELGVRPGDRVAILAENRLEVAEVLAATHKAGAVYVGLNFRFESNELTGALDNAEPRVLLVSEGLAAQATAAAAGRDTALVGLDDEGPEGYEALILRGSNRRPSAMAGVRPDQAACIVYTSGSTGQPKGVLFDHAAMIQHSTVVCLEYAIDVDTRYLLQIPHNSSVNITIFPCLAAGATLGFSDSRGFEPERFAAAVAHHRISHTFLVPTQLMRLLDLLDPEDDRLASLSTVGYGSSPIAPGRLGELVSRLGPIFIQLYGMAEIASVGTLLRKEDHVRALSGESHLLASCGRPSFAMDVSVVAPDGSEVEPGVRGEVVFTGPHMMRGYHRDPVRTAEAIIDGRMHSGDIAEVDTEGFVYIVDRLKNLIIRGGQNIVPTEIENVLYGHPAVLEVAVVGAPDPSWGERVVALVSLRRDMTVTEDELMALVETSGLARFKRPEQITVVDSVPKNAVGKIDKRAVRRLFWDGERQV